MSGIVNMVTKEGGQTVKGKISFQAGDVVTSHSDIFLDEIKNVDILSSYETEFNLSGPVPFSDKKVTFNFSGRFFNDDGYLYGERLYQPTDIAESAQTGDGEIISLRFETRMLKYAFCLSSNGVFSNFSI